LIGDSIGLSPLPTDFEEITMSSNLRSASVGFAFGIVAAAVAVQAAPAPQHEHRANSSAQSAPAESTDQMHKMMADPAKRKQMMDHMTQCRDMMSMMMEHMKHEGMKKDEAAPHK